MIHELYDAIDDDIVFLHDSTQSRRRRIFRMRKDYMSEFDDVDFKARFRLTKTSVQNILGLIKEKIAPPTLRNQAVEPMVKLLLTLRYFATGSYLMAAADFSGVSRSSACRFIKEVSESIAALRPQIICFSDDIETSRHKFYSIARFPRVVGAIDCTHVPIKSPGGENAEYYRNRKGTFSINVQAICDAELKILDIVARWPGSSHDQTIFNNSNIKYKFERGEFQNCLLLGDSGYANTNYLVTPLLNPNNSGENLYNESHIRTRNAVERCFGILKSRFPVLRKSITLSLNRTQAIIVACAVLHNIAIDCNDAAFPYDFEPETILVTENTIGNDDARRNLIRGYFSQLLNASHD